MRSDRTNLCVACRVRFSRALGAVCPVCERSDNVHDGRDDGARSAEARRLRARRSFGGRGWIGLDGARPATEARRRGLMALGAVMITALAVPFVAELMGLSPVLPIGVLVLLVLVWVGIRAALSRPAPSEPSGLALSIHEPPPLPRAGEARRIRGRVRVLSPAVAPLEGRACGAFRILGRAHGGVVDDAGGGVIEVVPSDGETPVRIDLSAATIALDVSDRAQVVTPSELLARFLSERWLFPNRGPVHIAEAVLFDGDPVELDAVVQAASTPEGYRETKVAQVAEDRVSTRVIIRRPPDRLI